ncbi:MAG: hypothetical protein IKD18_02450, partial [Clostridia bacterium]|nr:hypothetical protein [Clostridia bacterium]
MNRARILAHRSLTSSLKDKKFCDAETDRVLKEEGLSAEDRALYTRLYYGVTEKKITLDYYLSRLSTIPLNECQPEVLALLELGAYQLLYMDRIPPRAVLFEAGEIAKRIGINPNRHMSEADWAQIRVKVGQELAKIPTGLSSHHLKEKYRRENPIDLFNNLYHVRKRMDRHWPIGTQESLIEVMRKTNHQDVFAHAQILGFQSLEETPFIHHHSLSHTKDTKERFVADINLASPYFATMIKKLDNFILKYNAQFKVASQKAINRSDT